MKGGRRIGAGRPKGKKDTMPARVRKVDGVQLPTDADVGDILEFSKEILRTFERAWVEEIFAGDDRRLQFEVLRLAKNYAHGSPVSVSEVRVSRPEDQPAATCGKSRRRSNARFKKRRRRRPLRSK